jgi:hypothetical protein
MSLYTAFSKEFYTRKFPNLFFIIIKVITNVIEEHKDEIYILTQAAM